LRLQQHAQVLLSPELIKLCGPHLHQSGVKSLRTCCALQLTIQRMLLAGFHTFWQTLHAVRILEDY